MISRPRGVRRFQRVGLPPFQSLLDSHAGDVRRFLRALVGPGEAEDCFQETIMAALRAYPRLEDASNLRAWMLTIARRKALDAHRAGRRALPSAELPDVPFDPPEVSDPALWGAVRSLPPGERAAVVCRFVADLSYREVGRVVGCSEAAARQRVRSGIRRLREVWHR